MAHAWRTYLRSVSDLVQEVLETQASAAEMIDTRYVAGGMLPVPRLLAGMVYANEPLTIFPSFKTTIATAVATDSYSLTFTSIWELGGPYYSPVRFALLALMSIAALSTWVIISHQLWQPRHAASSRFLAAMYNTTTVVTVALAVIVSYAMIYLVLLAEGAVIMPPSRLEALLQRAPGPPTYLAAAIVTAPVGTLAGALGAGLEDTDRVRRTTFSWRMQQRFEEYERAREEDEGDEQEVSGDQ